MKKNLNPFLPVLTGLLFSCGNQGQPEVQYEGSEPAREIAEIDPDIEETYTRREFLASKFKDAQVKTDVLYCYWPLGLFLADPATGDPYARIETGHPVRVISRDGEYFIDKNLNAYGCTVWIDLGQPGGDSVFSGGFSALPYPGEHYPSLLDYALHNLHVTDSAEFSGIRHPNSEYDNEKDTETAVYFFEQGITVTDYQFYESSEQHLKIPGISVEEGFLFLNAMGFINLFDFFGTIPAGEEISIGYDESPNGMAGHAYVDDAGRPTEISVYDDGCGDWYTIFYDDEGVTTILTGGGC